MKKYFILAIITILTLGCEKSNEEKEILRVNILQQRLEYRTQLINTMDRVDTKKMIHELDSLMVENDSLINQQINDYGKAK